MSAECYVPSSHFYHDLIDCQAPSVGVAASTKSGHDQVKEWTDPIENVKILT